MTALAIGGLGTPELLIILAVVILLFGAAKLPELARGSGRALRIFKAETKGLMDDDDEDGTSASDIAQPSATQPSPAQSQAQLEIEAKQRDLAQRQAQLDAEAERLNRGDSA
jgi:sec-independent protein translocase protein TatA